MKLCYLAVVLSLRQDFLWSKPQKAQHTKPPNQLKTKTTNSRPIKPGNLMHLLEEFCSHLTIELPRKQPHYANLLKVRGTSEWPAHFIHRGSVQRDVLADFHGGMMEKFAEVKAGNQ